jgi:hypothetical protein
LCVSYSFLSFPLSLRSFPLPQFAAFRQASCFPHCLALDSHWCVRVSPLLSRALCLFSSSDSKVIPCYCLNPARTMASYPPRRQEYFLSAVVGTLESNDSTAILRVPPSLWPPIRALYGPSHFGQRTNG